MEPQRRHPVLSTVQASYVMAVLAFPFGLVAGLWLLSRHEKQGAYVVAISVVVGLIWIAVLTS
jgi:hypothetical protein